MPAFLPRPQANVRLRNARSGTAPRDVLPFDILSFDNLWGPRTSVTLFSSLETRGEVSEWLKEPASKAGGLVKPGSWVRIPPSPPKHSPKAVGLGHRLLRSAMRDGRARGFESHPLRQNNRRERVAWDIDCIVPRCMTGRARRFESHPLRQNNRRERVAWDIDCFVPRCVTGRARGFESHPLRQNNSYLLLFPR